MRPCASISCKIGDDKTRARKEEFPAMKTLPYDKAKIEEIAKTHPTPFHIYDEAGIVARGAAPAARLPVERGV